MKTKTIVAVIAILFLTSLVLSLKSLDVATAKEPSERFKGYNTQSAKWTTGNLGKAYFEGDFVSYMLRISSASKAWGATEFSISFNFHQDSSNAVYVDGFDVSDETGFQYTYTDDFLPDGTETPPGPWGTHIPTPEAGEPDPGTAPKIVNYMWAWPPGTTETQTPAGIADERYFTVQNLWSASGVPISADYVILFFRAHLALDIIWSNHLETALPTVLDGDQFESWTVTTHGASFATGSSRHFYLQYPGIGGKTIPIPIAQYPSTVISGHKYVDGILFDTWEIALHGDLALYGPWTIPYDPPPVHTGDAPWTTGYFEFTGLVTGTYNVTEEDRSGQGILHDDIIIGGDATNPDMNVDEGWARFDLEGGKTATVDFYNIRPGTIIGYKYEDMAGDGPGGIDNPIDGWAITLWKGSTNLGTVYTGTGVWPDGYYEFTQLRPDTYTVVEEDRIGWTHTSPSSIDLIVGPGETKTADFYNFNNTEITVVKWDDKNGNGERNLPEDVGIEGWHIDLYKLDGTYDWLADGNTGGDGSITFSDLGPGTYKVVEEDRIGWTHTYPLGGANYYDGITLTSGTPQSRDFGNFKNVKISGYKWNDLDGDGIWDPGEVGLGEWTIELYKWDGATWVYQTSTTTSDAPNLGYYEFADLGPGRYKVNEVDQTKWVQSYPLSPNYHDIAVTSGTNVPDKNFGNFHPKIQLTVTTTYDSDRKDVTFMITVTNPLPSALGVTVTTLHDVTVTSTLPDIPTIGPVDLPAGGSESLAAPYTYTFKHGDPNTFVVTFTATGLDADGDTVTVDITVTVTQP